MATSRGNRIALVVLAALALLFLFWQQRAGRAVPDTTSAADAGSDSLATAAAHDLAADETLGGHTLARHVGKSDRELAARLEREPGVAAASTFVDRAIAERVVGLTLEREAERIAGWMHRGRTNLALDFRGAAGQPVGRVLRRGAESARQASDARVVLRLKGDRYFVLTAYPVEP